LTTAAALLAAAGVGIAVALLLWLASVETTVLILVVNRVLGMIEARWLPGPAD
jgi:uncharacterized membrane protein YhiD involved in acid resistance